MNDVADCCARLFVSSSNLPAAGHVSAKDGALALKALSTMRTCVQEHINARSESGILRCVEKLWELLMMGGSWPSGSRLSNKFLGR